MNKYQKLAEEFINKKEDENDLPIGGSRLMYQFVSFLDSQQNSKECEHEEKCSCDGDVLCVYHSKRGYKKGWNGFKDIPQPPLDKIKKLPSYIYEPNDIVGNNRAKINEICDYLNKL